MTLIIIPDSIPLQVEANSQDGHGKFEKIGSFWRVSKLPFCLASIIVGHLDFTSPLTQWSIIGASPVEMATVAVPAVLMTPTAAMAADGMPPVVLGVSHLFSLVIFQSYFCRAYVMFMAVESASMLPDSRSIKTLYYS